MIHKKRALLLVLVLSSGVAFGAKSMQDVFQDQVVAENGSIVKMVKQSDGNTLLHYAVLKGTAENVKKVLNFKGCDDKCLLSVNKEKQTALHLAVQKGDLDIVKALLAKEAELNQPTFAKAINTAAIKDGNGKTPVNLAITKKNKEILTELQIHLTAQRGKKYDAFTKVESMALEKAIEDFLHEINETVKVRVESKDNAKPVAITDENDLLDMSELEKGGNEKVITYEVADPKELEKAVSDEIKKRKKHDPNADFSDLSFDQEGYKQKTVANLKVAKKEEEKVVAKVAEEVKKAQEAIQGKEQSLLSAKHVIGGAGLLAVCYLMYSIAREVKKLEKQIQANPDLVSVALEAAEIEGLSTIDLIAIVLQNKWNQLVG
jgi:hypothetical protein